MQDPNFREAIKKAWLAVRDECLEHGYDRFKGKDIKQLRDDLWRKKRLGTMSKYDNSQKTGTGATNWKPVFY